METAGRIHLLKQISVSNLGCFDEDRYTVNFSEETLIAGPNNSGKSMLLAGMNVLRHFIVTGSLSYSSQYFTLQSFEAAVHNHEMQRKIMISFTLSEGSKTHALDLTLARDGIIGMSANNHPIGSRQQPYVDLLKKVWCFSPNRSLVPYVAPVSPTAGPMQPLRPNGGNVINYLLERWTDRDENWTTAESWLRKIDPDMSQLKTPIKGNQVFLETLFGDTDVNVSMQGSGFQSAAAIVSAIVFSPEGTTVIIEEPEAFLHPSSQEVIVDMINDAVNNHNKQVIFSTHSCNILLPFYNDVGRNAASRSKAHVRADPKKFSMWTFEKTDGKISINPYPLQKKTFRQFRDDFKFIWG